MTEAADWKPMVVQPDEVEVEPSARGLDQWLDSVKDLEVLLVENKALVFRGFGVTADELEQVHERILPNKLPYVHGNSPRTKVGQNVYTSTEYRADLSISLHNELSYSNRWPSRLAFYCLEAPATGGATPITDGRRWLKSLDPVIVDSFSDGVRYTQNLPDGRGLGKSWQATFEADDRAKVEEFLATAAADWQWCNDGTLRIVQIREATTRHPTSGVEVWFNQADQWHPAGLDNATARTLAETMPEDELPQSVRLADGGVIPDEYIREIRDRGFEIAWDMDWHAGDLLLIDNVLVAHGRRPFTGARKVLVAMSG
ncbi:TauD/TfdA family dioxygenase [Rugosimonospora africana]|uniref:TauD/TfdA-like domain-containing protein n=1 Tax=Rugosimonospora africana TaxID=556532 RepID=A0A8J3QRI2_9ACTN|nr:TauD/TfdA family dioxygenase [Rugosimonospora africana]GIH15539.1 hypothetical protein Raf01_37110 [Rugosimonospora africana]